MLRSLLLAPPAALWLLAAPPPTPGRVAMSWAQLLKRVFGIEIDTCQRCGGTLRIVASIEQPAARASSFQASRP